LSAAAADVPAAPPAAAPAAPPARSGTLLHDALVTIMSRFILAVLILGSDVLIARVLGPTAKGRFALVLLYSQLAAVPISWGMDAALGVITGRGRAAARQGMANAIWWALLVGGAFTVLSVVAYGSPADPGPLASVIPNLSPRQFLFGAIALPGEVFFAVGLFGLLGRRRIVAYNLVRILRRGVMVGLVVTIAVAWTVDLDAALAANLAALGCTALLVGWATWRDGMLGWRPSPALLLEELRFGTRAIVGTLAERLQFRMDAFLLNGLVGVRATGIYSVTSGIAETLWYIPNSLGTVMFSRAVDPKADAAHVASVLTRTTVAVTFALAVPAWVLGPRFVRFLYGSGFADAGVALRWIIPGIVAYSVVAVLSRYVVGRGRPGLGTLVLLAGLGTNLVANLVLIPRLGIIGAAVSSSISYTVTAALTLAAFVRISGQGLRETLIITPRDLASLARVARTGIARLRGTRRGPILGLPGGETAAELVMDELEPGEER
jgi:O-antigen/teichoic acid export membrane protein